MSDVFIGADAITGVNVGSTPATGVYLGSEKIWPPDVSPPSFRVAEADESQVDGSSTLTLTTPAGTEATDLVVVILSSSLSAVSSWSGDLTQLDAGRYQDSGNGNTGALLVGTGFTDGDPIEVTAAHLAPSNYVTWAIAVVANASQLDFGTVYAAAPVASEATFPGLSGSGTALLMMSQSFGGTGTPSVVSGPAYTLGHAHSGYGIWAFYLDGAEDPGNVTMTTPRSAQGVVGWQCIAAT